MAPMLVVSTASSLAGEGWGEGVVIARTLYAKSAIADFERSRRSNPGASTAALRRLPLDCFASLAMTALGERGRRSLAPPLPARMSAVADMRTFMIEVANRRLRYGERAGGEGQRQRLKVSAAPHPAFGHLLPVRTGRRLRVIFRTSHATSPDACSEANALRGPGADAFAPRVPDAAWRLRECGRII
jgi:hypothetical protein